MVWWMLKTRITVSLAYCSILKQVAWPSGLEHKRWILCQVTLSERFHTYELQLTV